MDTLQKIIVIIMIFGGWTVAMFYALSENDIKIAALSEVILVTIIISTITTFLFHWIKGTFR